MIFMVVQLNEWIRSSTSTNTNSNEGIRYFRSSTGTNAYPPDGVLYYSTKEHKPKDKTKTLKELMRGHLK